jgi:parallel beta-helix repeat protein
MKYKKKKINKIAILFITLDLFIITLLITSFKQSLANYHHWKSTSDWTSSQQINTKRFIKEFFYDIKISFKKITTTKKTIINTLDQQQVPYYQINASNTDLKSLNSNLPFSGDKYINVTISSSESKQKSNAKLKYRGDNYYHWGFTKKSLKIKLPDGQVVNLINPKEINFIADQIGFKLAQKLGLYAPESQFVGLFINNEFKGIYQEVQEIDSLYANQPENNFKTIFQGENVNPTPKTGLGLFQDPNKWNISGNYLPKSTLVNFLSSINNNKDYSALNKTIDINYWAKFYSFVSIIQNCHYDALHNWFLGSNNNKLYPIIWDPVAWVQKYEVGNGVEDMKSPISETLRKNVNFNSLFINNLWKIINDENTKNWILNTIDSEKKSIFPILKYDYFKGGVWGNKNGFRAIQSNANIESEINNLEQKILTRLDFIKKTLSKASVTTYYDPINKYLYFEYSGLAEASINLPLDQITVYNNGHFEKLPNFVKYIFSGRTKERKGNLVYAQTCPITYRIKTINKNTNISIINELTNEEIQLTKKTKPFKINDCQMDFTPLINNNETAKKPPQNNKLEINFDSVNVADFFDPEEKINNEKIKINFQNQEYNQVEFDKNQFNPKLNLNLKKGTSYQGRERLDLLPYNNGWDTVPNGIQIAKSLNLPTPLTQSVNLYANNNYIGEYLLIEDIKNKSWFETNKLTFDTDIYQLKGDNPNNINDWDKINTDPHTKKDDFSTLKKLLNSLTKDLIDKNNLESFQEFAYKTGNEQPSYILYFDNTQGKFLILPDEFITYKPITDFQFKDSLLSNIYQSNEISDTTKIQNPNSIFSIEGKNITIKKSTYTINSNIIIPSGFNVTIEAGTTLKFKKNISLISFSPINAIGTSENPINITNKDNNAWGVFAIIGSEQPSTLKYLNIENGSEAFINNLYISGAFSAYHSNINIDHCSFKGSSSDDGINIKYADTNITNSLFQNNSADGIDFDFVTGFVENNTFIKNGNDSIDISGSEIIINNNNIQKSGDKCISIGEKSYPTITNNNLINCNIGIEIKDLSSATIKNNLIQDNNIGINAYQKKEFFGSGTANVYSTVFKDNKKDIDYQNTFTGTKLKSDKSAIIIY